MPDPAEEPVLVYDQQTFRLVAESLPAHDGGRRIRYVLTAVPTAIHPLTHEPATDEAAAFVIVRSSLDEVESPAELAAVSQVRNAVQQLLTAMGR